MSGLVGHRGLILGGGTVAGASWDGSWDAFDIGVGGGTTDGFCLPIYSSVLSKYLSRSTSDSYQCVVSATLASWALSGASSSAGANVPAALAVNDTGRIVLAGRYQTYYSDDTGATWKSDGANTYAKYMKDLRWQPSAGVFAARGSSDQASTFFTSMDGKDFNAAAMGFTTIGWAYSAALDTYVVIGAAGNCKYRVGSGSWIAASGFPTTSSGSGAVEWCGDRFIAVVGATSGSSVFESFDGHTWTSVPGAFVTTGASFIAYHPGLGEAIFSVSTNIYRHLPGSGVLTLAAARPYAATGIGYEPHSGQLIRMIGRGTSANIEVTRVS